MNHKTIIDEYFTKLSELDKLDIVRAIFDKYAKTLKEERPVVLASPGGVIALPKTTPKPKRKYKPRVAKADAVPLEIFGKKYASTAQVWKHFGLKVQLSYARLSRYEDRFPEKSLESLIELLVTEHKEKMATGKKVIRRPGAEAVH